MAWANASLPSPPLSRRLMLKQSRKVNVKNDKRQETTIGLETLPIGLESIETPQHKQTTMFYNRTPENGLRTLRRIIIDKTQEQR